MSNKAIQTLKGFRDFLPPEARKRNWLKEKITETFELWGYDPLETPTLEPLELFKGQIGEDENLFFQFEDQGGRKVALRYDQTVPTCRVVGQYFQQLPTPFKRYQIQSAFRAEKPQKGRYREFVQCDADIFGIDSPLADAEVIALSIDIYRRLGFKNAQVLVNDRTLMKNMPYEAIVSIDKLKKIGEQAVIQEMVKKGINEKTATDYLEQVLNNKPNKTIQTILDYLENMRFDRDWYAFDPTIARSFSYSDGPIWEVVIPGFEAGSVLGGERFDGLVEKVSGNRVPATGFAVGFDRTLEAAEQFGLIPNSATTSRVLATIFDPALLSETIAAVQQLRQAGINTELFPDDSADIRKQLKYANKKNIPYVVIMGAKEAMQNKVTLKNMTSGEQELLKIEEVIGRLS